MYDCSKITRITVMYVSQGPGTYAGEKRKILGLDESRAICEEANRRGISIEMLLKARERIESVVINTVVPFKQPEQPSTEVKQEPSEGYGAKETPKPVNNAETKAVPETEETGKEKTTPPTL